MPKPSEINQSSFKAGMYLLETLTAGMYNEPLSIYREYVQNAVDSIDMVGINNNIMNVEIELDPFERRINISDNGFGIPTDTAQNVLSSIGSSNKVNHGMRGFRGIGRLGGIAFSDKAIFRTKAKGETIESVQEWDCKKLREYLADTNKSTMPIDKVFNKITTFHSENSKKSTESYFKVTLEGVSSFRNYIFDFNKVKKYLSQIAPVPFNPDEFSHGSILDNQLSKNLSNYGSYKIILNGEPIYKPYRDYINTTSKGTDSIEEIIPIMIEINSKQAAYGWYGKRRNLLGAIAKGDYTSGIRVRVGNILIGDSHLLDGCFREARFNSYVIGEIHVDCQDLIPNSRRDDFVDNSAKTLFYNAVEREIGIIISKEIRLQSKLGAKSNQQNIINKNELPIQIKNKIPNSPKLNPYENGKVESAISDVFLERNIESQKLITEMRKSCGGCDNFSKILSFLNNK